MEEKNNLKIFSAPIQGLTELPWRRFHHDIYGDGITGYFTPFLRVERGEVRRRDVRDLNSEMNGGVPLTPQIIFRDVAEFEMLCDIVCASGFSHIDINMGCPFPPQVHHGRGTGMIANVPLLTEIAAMMKGRYSDVTFSVKMRLGVDSPTEWNDALPVINNMPLSHLTVHPRTARQQYSGELWLDEFSRLLDAIDHPVVFNGDLREPSAIDDIYARFPGLYGVMIGRGLFSRPSMVAEWLAREEWTPSRRMQDVLRLHSLVYGYYKDSLSGDAQVLGKIKPFWEYMVPDLDKKAYKGIKKASSLRKYDDAVSMIINNR
ncbi:MAG: tRNA-dihydrouridine synthase family protein [Paenibacillus sp.]|nr:tRNA-dihydrouridine synthase family protein [Paenibacillus sp.]